MIIFIFYAGPGRFSIIYFFNANSCRLLREKWSNMGILGLRIPFSPGHGVNRIPTLWTSLIAVLRGSQRACPFVQAFTLGFGRPSSFSTDHRFRTKKEQIFEQTVDREKKDGNGVEVAEILSERLDQGKSALPSSRHGGQTCFGIRKAPSPGEKRP